MKYNINFDLCAIIINVFSIYILVNRKDMKRNYNKVFLTQIILAVFSCMFDILSATAIMNKNYDKIVICTFTSFYNLTHSLIPFMSIVYVILLSGVILKEKYDKLRNFCIAIPISIIVGLLSVNGIYHFVFSIDNHLEYHRGPMLYVIYVCEFFYVIQGIYYLLRYGSAIPIGKRISVYMLIIFSIGSVMYQFFFPDVLIELFAEAITSGAILFCTEDGFDVINPITNIYNKTAFMEDNSIYYNLNREYTVFGIKILDFDRVKLRYGNPNTEKMLKEIGVKLVSIADDEVVYDLDNGVFAVLIRKHTDYRIHKIENEIKQMFENGWKYEKITVYLKIQINKIFVPDDADCVTTLINKIQTRQVTFNKESDMVGNNEKKLIYYVQ
ncbi:diguanylate cyclase domain-containing protein [Lachnobacterium bovis]|uniref:GGDEF domain-containing protein, diguanylate cyclase (C-di-GMP synthetase) or its enzymatically inactive variants n=1 Tax=Lachnobacterium bovis TaxID=140626 RepID=A0A1H9Q211_9FIRM|nr:diguanylate cyclase [Lachnobacterium bovis]SER54422.1 GGDEF domain-containing protein, diguanylate cyclase (c-di-GMP synthetase) or its enzymatically inactive variants [Lachnobacterium bovis]